MVKKQIIMEKALELFAEKGIESTSIQQITEHCGISKGAFYLSFKSKDELISALIDHFMMQFISNIDYTVRSVTEEENLLYEFYNVTFNTFLKHSGFTKILIKEQTQTFNEELILKIYHYNTLIEEIILSMIKRLYCEKVDHIKYDLMYCIKSFMHTYSELILYHSVPLDLDLLSKSLVEKTNLLAIHTTIPFISSELVQTIQQPLNKEVTKEKMFEIIEEKIDEMNESIEKESLILLKQQLLEPTLSPAIVKGLLENIRNHPHCNWIAYLLRRYFGF